MNEKYLLCRTQVRYATTTQAKQAQQSNLIAELTEGIIEIWENANETEWENKRVWGMRTKGEGARTSCGSSLPPTPSLDTCNAVVF